MSALDNAITALAIAPSAEVRRTALRDVLVACLHELSDRYGFDEGTPSGSWGKRGESIAFELGQAAKTCGLTVTVTVDGRTVIST